MQHPNIELCPIETLTPYDRNARTHSAKQIDQIAKSIERFGFTNPVLVDDAYGIIAGHGRVAAAKTLNWSEVPVIRLSHLSEAEKRAYILADNKLAENAGWDQEILAIELQGLMDVEFDVGLTGFDTAEIDIALEAFKVDCTDECDEHLDAVPKVGDGPALTRPGDIWSLGKHRLICGDAGSPETVRSLCSDAHGLAEDVTLMFTDPPYNVPIDGNVSGQGKHKHREFEQASGEMSKDEFVSFLKTTLGAAASTLKDGAIAYVCMDWRHMEELLEAGSIIFDDLKNLCVWNKTNAGMGSFYRSKHELVFVFKKGSAPHINNFELGQKGRYRTNVWDYAGVNSFGEARDEALAMHPTVKPVALIADAIKDCSRHGDIVLDVFGGSGSTLIAAEQTGRRARLVELDPLYCDTIVRRWQELTGNKALLAASGENFADLAEAYATDQPTHQQF